MASSEEIEFIIKMKDLMSKGLNDINSKLNGLENNVNNTKSGISSLKLAMGNFAGNLLTKATDSVWGMAKGIVQLGIDAEQTKTAFETMMGSAEAADKHISDLKAFAASTPFGFEELSENSKLMQGYQIEAKKVLPFLSMIGDVSMGNKEKLNGLSLAFAQVQSAGKLTGQDLLQMINQGFNPLGIISKRTGKSISELKEDMAKGAISADMVTQAFIDATSEGGQFYNMLGKQSKTVGGRISTLVDDIKAIGLKIAEVVLPAVGWLVDNFMTLSKVIGVTVGAFGLCKLATLASTLSTISFSGAFAALNAVIAANPIGAVLVGLTALGALFVWLWDKSEGFRSTLYGVWEVLKNIGSNIGDIFGDGLVNGLITIGKKIYDFLLTPFYELLNIVDKVAGTDYSKSLKSMLSTKSIFEGSGEAYAKGVQKGLDSFKQKEGLKISKEGLMTGQTSTKTTSTTKGSKTLSNEVAKVQSRQPSNVYINIDAIIKGDVNNMINNANNPKQDLNNFLVQLENALLSVVNDVNLVTK